MTAPTPKPTGIFRHTDGGIYQVTAHGKHTTNGEEVVIYRHLWPFEQLTWVRPLVEWEGRFTKLTEMEVNLAMLGDRIEAQLTVSTARAARKAKEKR